MPCARKAHFRQFTGLPGLNWNTFLAQVPPPPPFPLNPPSPPPQFIERVKNELC